MKTSNRILQTSFTIALNPCVGRMKRYKMHTGYIFKSRNFQRYSHSLCLSNMAILTPLELDYWINCNSAQVSERVNYKSYFVSLQYILPISSFFLSQHTYYTQYRWILKWTKYIPSQTTVPSYQLWTVWITIKLLQTF